MKMNPKDISFVVQGAIDRSVHSDTGRPVTQTCLESLRRHYPQSEIILSTWRGQDVSGLDFDLLLESEDPGGANVLPPESGRVQLDNMNRQIVSSRNGLLRASGDYAVKIRTDWVLGGRDWMDFVDRYPVRAPEWKIFKQRVIACSLYARDPRCPQANYAFHPSDCFHAGLTEDLRLLWDIPLQPQPESAQWFLNRPLTFLNPIHSDLTRWDNLARYYPEQYLWVTLLSKFGVVDFPQRRDATKEDIRVTEISFANNLIILDPDQFPINSTKDPYPGSGPAHRFYRLLLHKEWERLYLNYCAEKEATAALKAATDPDFYLKRIYAATFKPLQKIRERAVAGKS
jgi:hypothetical protein